MSAPPSIELPIRQHQLANGLRVILSSDRVAPIVAVNLWYHVGSKDERPGRTGLAHLFEHMLFQGSANVATNQHFALIQQRGGTANGSTWYDRTNYHETLPARELDLALWLESDRMGFLLDGLSQEKLDTQRAVVKNERRWRVDNQPYGTWLERGMELLFPAGHPYHWPVIGYMSDLDAASLDDVRDFFRTHYLPGNAVLSLVGDFDPDDALARVERYFGAIPAGDPPPRVDARLAPAGRERRVVVEDQVELPRVFLLYAIPAYGSEAWYALDFASDLLAAGKSSRLYRHLVHELELAKDATAFTFNNELSGNFLVVATPRPGVEPERLISAIDHQLDRLRRSGPAPEESQRALNRIETAFVGRLESAEQRADLLSMYATYFDDPRRILSEASRYQQLGPEQVAEAARLHLDPDRRVTLTYVPRAERALAAVPAAPPLDRSRPPSSGVERHWGMPKPERVTLPNGLRLVAAPVTRIPIVSGVALLDAGSCRDPLGADGLAALTVSLLDEGTSARSAMAIAEAMEALGAALVSDTDVDSASLGVSALSRNFEAAWTLLSESLTGASFPDRELERVRHEHLAQLVENRSSPGGVADEVAEKLLFGAHPYAHPVLGSQRALEALDRARVAGFADRCFRPETTTIVLTGDLSPERALREVERTLGRWPAAAARSEPIAPPEPPAGRRLCLIDRPGAAQSELRLVNLALPRTSPDHVAAEVMNSLFGGKFTSRLNLNLRERHGYTYGARSWIAARRATGVFGISTAVETGATLPALREILGEIDRLLSGPVGSDELEDTRSFISGLFPLTIETSGDVLGRLAEIELYGLADDHFERYPDRVRAVSAEDVLRVARDNVRPDRMVVLVVGDAARLAGPLSELGTVEQLDEDGNRPAGQA